MNRILRLFFVFAMVLSMSACGSVAEPVETTAVATGVAVQVTEEPTEEATEEMTEAPTEPEPVDPATLPAPIPVEEQLTSEDTQTVVLGSLAEYEELLNQLGFTEIALNDTCEPVNLTYNANAFRLNFTYHYTENTVEEDWYIYGTKSNGIANISKLDESSLNIQEMDTQQGISQQEENTPAFCYDKLRFCSTETRMNVLRMIYFPFTGSLYNYLQDPESEGNTDNIFYSDDHVSYSSSGYSAVGTKAGSMQFHIRLDVESALAMHELPEVPDRPEMTDICVDQILQNSETQKLSKAENSEYAAVLEKMGYMELLQPMKNPDTPIEANRVGTSDAFAIVSMSYNGEVFKMELTVKDSPPYEQTMYVYGAKSDVCGNITNVGFDQFDTVTEEEFPRYTVSEQAQNMDIMRFHAWYGSNWNPKSTPSAFYAEIYFPTTGSLYNLISMSSREERIAFGVPNGLLPTAEGYLSSWITQNVQLLG